MGMRNQLRMLAYLFKQASRQPWVQAVLAKLLSVE